MVATVESLGKLLKWVLITLLMWMGMIAQINSHCKLLFCHLPRGWPCVGFNIIAFPESMFTFHTHDHPGGSVIYGMHSIGPRWDSCRVAVTYGASPLRVHRVDGGGSV